MKLKQSSTREEIAARGATEIWNRPLPANPEKLNDSPLFCGVPYFDNLDVLTPGHSRTCGCSDCWNNFAYGRAAEGREQW